MSSIRFINQSISKNIHIETNKNQPAKEHAGKYDNDGLGFGSTTVMNTNTGYFTLLTVNLTIYSVNLALESPLKMIR